MTSATMGARVFSAVHRELEVDKLSACCKHHRVGSLLIKGTLKKHCLAMLKDLGTNQPVEAASQAHVTFICICTARAS